MKRILFTLMMVSNLLIAMDDPAPYKDKAVSDKKKSVSFLSELPATVGTQLVLPLAAAQKLDRRDNRQDIVIERSKKFGNLTHFAQETWGNSDVDERPMVDATVTYMRTHPLEQSHFTSNVLSVTSALPVGQEKLKKLLLSRMASFPALPQVEKDKVVVDAIKACPLLEVIQPMIEGGATVHAHDAGSRCTLLHFAARGPGAELVTFLLARGAHVDATDRLESTPLHTAVQFHNLEAAQLITEKTEQPNLWDWAQHNALYYAVLYGDTPMAELLLRNKACIYYYDTTEDEAKANDDIFKKNVLAIAAAHGNLPLLVSLFEARKNTYNPAFSLEMMINAALIVAAQRGNHEIVNFLLSLSNVENCPIKFDKSEVRPKIMPDLVLDEHSAVGYALLQDHFFVAYKLLDYSRTHYASVMPHCRASRRDSLRIAVQKLCELPKDRKNDRREKKLREIISLFLSEGTEPTGGFHPSPAFIAAKYGNKKLLKKILKAALDLEKMTNNFAGLPPSLLSTSNKESTTHAATNRLIFELARAGCATGMHTLLQLEVSPRITDIHGDTPLHKAMLIVDGQNLTLIDDLINKEINIAAKNTISGDTPLHKVMKHPHKNDQELAVNKLLDHFKKQERLAEIDTPNNEGNTPLMSICGIHTVANNIIKLLVAHGAGINKQNAKGQTPLFIAASKGSLENVRELLAAGADPNTTNLDGCGPLTKAAKNGNRQMINALIDVGANFPQFKDGMLRAAAKGGHIVLMKWLLHHRANINGKSTSYGYTPLHRAVQYRQHDAIEFLLKEGADVNAQDAKNNIPLDIAIGLPDQEGKAILCPWINKLRARQ